MQSLGNPQQSHVAVHDVPIAPQHVVGVGKPTRWPSWQKLSSQISPGQPVPLLQLACAAWPWHTVGGDGGGGGAGGQAPRVAPWARRDDTAECGTVSVCPLRHSVTGCFF